MSETFAATCQAPRCRYASLLLPSLDVAQAAAAAHATREGHRVLVTRREERAVSVHGELCACSEAVKP